jgi:hypothetical protein
MQSMSPIQPLFAKCRLENICEFSRLRGEFPTRRRRELFRRSSEPIPPFGPEQGI